MQLEELVLPLRTDNKAFKAGLAVAAAGVAALVAGMGLAIKATFKWADELDQIGDIMGVTDKQAAALNFTLRKSGVATETLTKGMVILEKGLVKADGTLDTTGKRLKEFGINVLDANGNVKDQAALIDEISQRYNEFGTQQERVNFLTETFGRSGAKLIDFFDTLAAEGGIDSVAAKVERLGLAIDPNRYEQFNRNLEELKLIGLGLAVSFTEKVMPVVEKFLEMISDPKGIDVSKILEWADNTIASFVKGLGDSINNWTASGGPEELSEALIGWIEGIGDSDAVKSKTQIAMEHLVQAMGEALANINWSGVWAAIDAKLDELDPIVTKAIDDAFISGDAALNNAFVTMDETLNNAFITMDGTLQEAFVTMDAKIVKWATVDTVNALNGLEASLTTKVRTALTNLGATIQTKLGDISKTFEQKAYSWVNKAVDGFNQAKSKLTSAITAVVTEINRILSKIISTFTLNFGGVNWGGNTGGATGDATGALGSNSGSPGTTGAHAPGGGRASGGPIIGGRMYPVGELGPEMFVPSTSGRIVPNNMLGQQPSTTRLDDDQLRTLASLIGTTVIKEMNNA